MRMKTEPRFLIARDGGQVAGPYDVAQMAGLLRRKVITGDTSTCLEGADDWKPFSWQPQFSIAREMPADAVSSRMVELDEAAAEAKSGPIPLPSRETMLKLAGLLAAAIGAFLVAFFFGAMDATTGFVLAALGGAAALVAQCMIMARLLDEDYWTLAMVCFVPGGDIYYFLSHIWEYFTWFCIKYVGMATAAGALAGIALHAR